MPQSLAKVILHITFSTKQRQPLIRDEVQPLLHGYLRRVCASLGAEAHGIGGAKDHVHVACSLPRTVSLSQLVQKLKTHSSRWMKEQVPNSMDFGWQTGYAVFSVGQSQLPALVRYVERQKAHHRKRSFREEFLEFVRSYEVEFDERFLWD